MPQTDIASSESSDLKSAFAAGTENYFDVPTRTTEAQGEAGETRIYNTKWTKYFGYYKKIPELRRVIDAKALWTVGKGFKADPDTTLILDGIRGNGKDTFNSILENAARTKEIGGGTFTHIIRDDEKNLINLKPLDPQSMVTVIGDDGLLTGFEQISKIKGKTNKKFAVDEVFYIARNRVADEVPGQSLIEPLEETILMINEAMADWRRVLHRNIDPMMIYHLDTDDTTKIGAFKAKVDAARGKGDNMYIPKDAVVPEQLSLAPNASLNPLAWIEGLKDRFYEESGVPKIVVGGAGGFTEAAVKIAYLAFQQTIEEAQLELEEQVGMQLGLEIELEFPASLENELLSDKKKDEANGASQPNDTTTTGVTA